MKDRNKQQKINRRKFLTSSAIVASAITIIPRHVLGGPGFTAPSDKLNVACIGIGGKGRTDVGGVDSENIIALCDVDLMRAKELNRNFEKNAIDTYKKAKFYKDFREMFEKEKSIDAVTISTPDHTHAIITMEAMKRGIHVYTQKPITRTIGESRKIVDFSKKAGIISQMGNQGHAGEGPRILNELIWDGAIGKVTKVHCWTDRPIWPQGIKSRPVETVKVPESLDWDLWVGPSPYRDYHPSYVPFNWRGWWDFGCGALGDMGCHILDYPFWALKLTSPLSIEASSTPVYKETAPHAAMVTYMFESGIDNNIVQVIWYDGGLKPLMPEGVTSERDLWKQGSAVLFEGTDGILLHKHHGARPYMLKGGKEVPYEDPKMVIPRSIGHYMEWIDEIKGGNHKAMANFNYTGPLNEAVLLGNIAVRAGKKIEWDALKLQVINHPEANVYINEESRNGWSL